MVKNKECIMTFQGDKIFGKPKMALLETYIAEKGLYCDPQGCLSLTTSFLGTHYTITQRLYQTHDSDCNQP